MVKSNNFFIKVALSLVLLLISSLAMVQSIEQSKLASATVEYTHNLLNLSKNISAKSFDFTNAASEHAYLSESDRHKQLKRLNNTRDYVLNTLVLMQTITAGKPDQQKQLDAVQTAFIDINNEFDDLQPNKGGLLILGPKISIVTVGNVFNLNAILQDKLRAFDFSLQDLSKKQLSQASHKSFIAQTMMLLSLITGAGILLVALMQLRREIDQREKAEERWKFALESDGEGICDWNLETGNIYYSKQWADILGWPDHKLMGKRSVWEQSINAKDRPNVVLAVNNCLQGVTSAYDLDYRLVCKGKPDKWVRERGIIVGKTAKGKASRVVSTLKDITQRKQSEWALSIAAIAFESQEGMMVMDADTIVLRVNSAFTTITGYSADEVVGKTPNLLSAGRHEESYYAEMWATIERTGVWNGEVWNQRKSGDHYPQKLSIKAIKNAENVVTNYIATIADITDSIVATKKIQDLTTYNPTP